MHSWHFVLGHVTRDTVVGAHGADFDRMGAGGRGRTVTAQASVVVRGQIAYSRLMRVVTGQARDAVVALDPALASFQAIGLEAKIAYSERLAQNHIHVGAVASAAEIHLINWIKLAGIENRL